MTWSYSSGALVWTFVALVGCSGSSAGTYMGSSGGSAGASSGGSSSGGSSSAGGSGGSIAGGNAGGSSGSSGTSGGTGGSSAGSAGTDAGGGGTGGSAGSGGTSGEQPLLPLVPGHVWTFEFTAIDDAQPMTDTCAVPTVTVGQPETIQDVSGIHYESFCSATQVLVTGSGDSLMAHIIATPDPPTLGDTLEFIHSPVVEGESWLSGTTMYTWAEVPGMVEVAAGTFSNCWQRVAQPGVVTLTYCRGVGLVSGIHATANWTVQLVSKNF